MKLKPLIIGDITAKVHIIQGGMGIGVSLSGLAGAVAKEGIAVKIGANSIETKKRTAVVIAVRPVLPLTTSSSRRRAPMF